MPTTAATAYTTPASGAVIRELCFVNTTAAAINAIVTIGTSAAATRIFGADIPANSTVIAARNMPLANTEIVQWVAAATGLTGSIGGATL